MGVLVWCESVRVNVLVRVRVSERGKRFALPLLSRLSQVSALLNLT